VPPLIENEPRPGPLTNLRAEPHKDLDAHYAGAELLVELGEVYALLQALDRPYSRLPGTGALGDARAWRKSGQGLLRLDHLRCYRRRCLGGGPWHLRAQPSRQVEYQGQGDDDQHHQGQTPGRCQNGELLVAHRVLRSRRVATALPWQPMRQGSRPPSTSVGAWGPIALPQASAPSNSVTAAIIPKTTTSLPSTAGRTPVNSWEPLPRGPFRPTTTAASG